jgi:stearoyl-CoA desaturase (delta-9 desaturase)
MAMLVSVVLPLIGLVAAIVLLWNHRRTGWGTGWAELVTMLAMYALAGFGVTIGYHRLLTHQAFKTFPVVRWLFAILGSSAGQGMVIRWVAVHRRHHQQSDREGDPHSPHLHGEGFLNRLRGFWHSHLGWAFQADKPNLSRSVPDLTTDRVMMQIDQFYLLWVLLGILLPAFGLGFYRGNWQGFFAGLIWGGLVRICLMQHVTWSVNSVCHVWGARPFNSSDHSANNLAVALLSLGEGWHNNHHAFPTSARHGLRWYQFDPSYLIIVTMNRLGLAWDLRLPGESAMTAKQRRG